MQIRDGDLVDGRYRLEQEVTIAGFSKDDPPVRLYNGVDEQLERPVTLQVLSASEARDPFRLQRFVRNGQLAAALHHPHVAGVYDAGEWNGWPYWVMARMGDASADSLYDESATPNIALALTATRHTAEALQGVRDAGMSDWTFSHQAARVSPNGDACLYPVMGLERLRGPDAAFTSSTVQGDPRALSGLLRLMLVGAPDPRVAGTRMLGLPAHVVALLDKMYLDDAPGKLTSAGEVAAAIAEVEASAGQPTEAYDPAQPPQPAPDKSIAMPYYGPAGATPVTPTGFAAAALSSSTPDAPTLAAPVPPPQDTRATSPIEARPYVPVTPPPKQTARRPGVLPILPLLALLLLAGAVAVLWPKTNAASGSVADKSATNTPAQAQLAVVPDVRGKTLEEANGAIGLAGLHLGQTDPVRDPNFGANTVVRQVPDPGTPLRPGDLVTVTLSLGPEPTAVRAQPAIQPNPQPQQPKPEPPDKKKKKDKDKDH
ncbi:MAG TPA: PASTA domain-containing protein [Chloroflexia bacterium]|jgi:serine/threonine-protein kinase